MSLINLLTDKDERGEKTNENKTEANLYIYLYIYSKPLYSR